VHLFIFFFVAVLSDFLQHLYKYYNVCINVICRVFVNELFTCSLFISKCTVCIGCRGTEEQVAANLKKIDRLFAEVTLLKVT